MSMTLMTDNDYQTDAMMSVSPSMRRPIRPIYLAVVWIGH
jgi:hypothetical protein